MSEEQELQAKIAALAGRINAHKRGPASWQPVRGTPYGQQYQPSRYRGTSRHMPPTHRNRTLVINKANQNMVAFQTNNSTESSMESMASNWVSKRDRHMQLINTSVYDERAQQRQKDIADTAKQRRAQRNMEEKAKISRHFDLISQRPDQQVYEVMVDEIRFRVVDGGSKLIKVTGMVSHSTNKRAFSHLADDVARGRSTPKSAKIGGVTFLRSKNGNLYRSGLVKIKAQRPVKKLLEPCQRFSTTGTCPEGPRCRYIHDPHKVAICKEYLQKGSCSTGDLCDLSHDCSANRVPACVHFLRGNCTNDSCRYAHVRVNPGAPVCRPFAVLGYCEEGANCTDRHVIECPDYANKGICRNKKCRLPHVDRAGQLRKANAGEERLLIEEDNSSDISSDENGSGDDYRDDVDSDEDILLPDLTENAGHELSQQDDFVGF
ncbi:hypothetical protein M501DRAFT_249036 [Patellaria atrata CBS 101060]|uniref:C3H1-type domain-containing protein n=1 Tax=Patellaria atrata CBS 101060 TaxID=1346257 RepID=A0A9P4S7A2_9PEZI|nr:hypothetical protein M501DRAFT_249036 [Patellaria atrata CBS 101060]